MAYYSAPEVVDQGPPQYPGSPTPQNKQPYYSTKGEPAPVPVPQGEEVVPQKDERKILGLPMRRFFIILGVIAIIILAIALGAGLGVGLSKKDDDDS